LVATAAKLWLLPWVANPTHHWASWSVNLNEIAAAGPRAEEMWTDEEIARRVGKIASPFLTEGTEVNSMGGLLLMTIHKDVRSAHPSAVWKRAGEQILSLPRSFRGLRAFAQENNWEKH
jgi:hypothetical protein